MTMNSIFLVILGIALGLWVVPKIMPGLAGMA